MASLWRSEPGRTVSNVQVIRQTRLRYRKGTECVRESMVVCGAHTTELI